MAQHRHKRETNARRTPRAVHVAAPLAVLATLSAVTAGVLSATPAQSENDLLASSATGSLATATDFTFNRETTVSRSQSRRMGRRSERALDRMQAVEAREQAAKATRRAVKNADARLWTTAELNIWSSSSSDARNLGTIAAVKKVLVTGRRDNGRAEVVLGGESRWVSSNYLSDEKPDPGPSLGGTCANGSSIDAGRASLYEIHDVVCANWPEITSYGTWRSDGEHGQGRAIDIMVSGETGWEIAEFLRENYSALGIEYIIYSQQMWSVERGGEGWRGMSDRGSTTANHYDHVHVTVY